ncbi:antigen-presenting glycoprotein CD1d-like [Alligator mississippiensis]|uniref:antigen-presenting glycoprotein CD1d-like n=1 Tax=Alligator mississippiensis TaxID=8496 RepID=UPI0028775F84|nr:antigen-presenting glycoprotein CD1d-like [Alligator mississippiensis]
MQQLPLLFPGLFVARGSLLAFPMSSSMPSLPPPMEPQILRLLVTMVFHDTTRAADTQGTALLGDVPTHAMDCGTCPIRFHQPWARQGLSSKQWGDLEKAIHLYLVLITQTIATAVQGPVVNFPFVIQILMGCEILPNGTSYSFYQSTWDRHSLVRFNLDTGEWVAAPGDEMAQQVCRSFSQDRGTSNRLRFLLQNTCVAEILSFAYYGKGALKRQERPVAVVFARQPPIALELPQLLICRVTGFYPRPIRVTWLRDGEEVTPGPGLNSSSLLPNADLTYQLRIVLAIDPGAGHSYACRVEHSSLGHQGLIVYWGPGGHWAVGLAVGIAVSLLAAAGLAAVLWWMRHRSTWSEQRNSMGL